MTKDSKNPFVLPGFGQPGEAGHNPLFAGLEMMNQAWQGLAKGNPVNAEPIMSIEDLDKKIRELQTVHNWLQLNATMLANTIQGLEIQRSTLSMMKSFAASAATAGTDDNAAKGDNTASGAEYAQAATEWWQLLQQQFEQITEATTAGLQSMAEAAGESKPVSKTSKTAKPTSKATTKKATTAKATKKPAAKKTVKSK